MTSCNNVSKPSLQPSPARTEGNKPASPQQKAQPSKLPATHSRDNDSHNRLEKNLSNLLEQQVRKTQNQPSREVDGKGRNGQEQSNTHPAKNTGNTNNRQHGHTLGQTAGGGTGVAQGHQHENHTHTNGNGHIKHHTDGHSDSTPDICDGLPGVAGPTGPDGSETPSGALPVDTGNNTVTSPGGGLSLQVRGLLQGPFDPSSGLMNDTLRAQGLLPETIGNATASAATLATTGNDAPVDWVVIELRDVNNPDQVVASQMALIQRDGDVADAQSNDATLHFADVPAGEYFVTLEHRNHLGAISSSPVSLSADATLIDFTNPDTVAGSQTTSNAAGNSMLWAGNANGDNRVIADGPNNDLNAVLNSVLTDPNNPSLDLNFASGGYQNSDVNLDGQTTYTGANSDASLINANAPKPDANSTHSSNFVLQGTVAPSQALLDSFWF